MWCRGVGFCCLASGRLAVDTDHFGQVDDPLAFAVNPRRHAAFIDSLIQRRAVQSVEFGHAAKGQFAHVGRCRVLSVGRPTLYQTPMLSRILSTVVVEQLACLAVARTPKPALSSSLTRLCRSASTGRP